MNKPKIMVSGIRLILISCFHQKILAIQKFLIKILYGGFS